MHFQIGLCPGPYKKKITQKEYRKNIRSIEYVLRGKKKQLVRILEREMAELSRKGEFERAAKRRDEAFALKHIQDVALLMERKMEYKTRNVGRLECYDISHISGENPVASMVVFENEKPNTSLYRKFMIKSVTGINDVSMMREILARRLRHTEWKYRKLSFLMGERDISLWQRSYSKHLA